MKQKRLLGLALASLLVLSGCSSSAVKEDGKYVVASIDGKNILADDIYEKLSSSTAGKNALFTYLLDQLITANFPVTSDMKDNASNIVSNIEASYKNQYSDNDEAQKQLESALSSSGYESMDAYKESLIQSLQYSEFIKKYVKANFDEVFEDYYKQEAPRYISMIKVSMSDPDKPTETETEKLNEVKSLLKTDKGFAEIASSYSDDDSKSAKGNLGIIDSTSGLKDSYGEDVEKAALSLEKGKVSDAIKGTNGYYFLYCTSTDKDTIKKDLETIDIDSPLLVYDSYIVYLAFNTYELKYSDEKIEKNVKEIVDEALKARSEEREGINIMKKLMMLLLCGGLLVACSSDSGYSVKVSKSDDAMITGSELKMTKQDYFNQLLDQYGAQQVLSEALTTIADKEVTDQEEINKLVAEREKTYAKNANGDLEKYAKSLGYDSKEEYSQEVLVPDVKQELLRNKYIKENLEKMIKDYQVVSFKKIVVTKESEALTIIKESTSAEIFDKKLKDAGTNGEDAGIVTKNSTLDDNLKSQLSQLSAVNKDGVYSEAIKLSDDSYAVLYLYNTDHKNTDELINKLTSDGDVQKEIEGIYLKKYNFKVNDSKIKDAIKKLSSEYIE